MIRKEFFHVAALLILIAITGLFASCDIVDPNPGPEPLNVTGSGGDGSEIIDTIPPSIERGQELFLQYCARCHGEDGSGAAIWPASIQGKIGIHDIVRNGRRGMIPIPGVSDSGIVAIELYLNSFEIDLSGMSDAELYDFYCASCHGPEATGTNIYPGNIQSYTPIHGIVREGFGEMLPMNIPDSVIVRIQDYLNSFIVDFKTLSGREYYDRLCASCHGLEGEGSTRGPEIRNPSDPYATWIIRNGRPGLPWYTREMPRYDLDSLSSRQLTEMLAWLDSAPKPTDGENLYKRFCGHCHGPEGRGGTVGENVKNETDEFRETIRDGEGGNDYGDRGDYMPRWNRNEITDSEIDKMIDYIRSIR